MHTIIVSRKAALTLLLALAAGATPALAADTPPSSIGIIAPLTGGLAEYGTAVRSGIELAVEDTAVAGKAPVTVVWEDTHGDTATALSAFEKLASSDGVKAVYIWGTTPTEGVAPVAEKRGVPLLAMSFSPTAAKGRASVIRSVDSADTLVVPLARYLKRKGVASIALLKTEWSYTDELAKSLRKELGDGITITEYPVARDERDFRTAVAKIKAKPVDAVGVFLGSGQISTFYKQAAEGGLSSPTFGTDFFGSRKEIADSGPGIEGAVFPQLASCEPFADRVRKKAGSDSHLSHATNSYDMATMLVRAAADGTDGAAVLASLRTPGERKGVCGSFTFVADEGEGAHFSYPIGLYRVVNGQAVAVTD